MRLDDSMGGKRQRDLRLVGWLAGHDRGSVKRRRRAVKKTRKWSIRLTMGPEWLVLLGMRYLIFVFNYIGWITMLAICFAV